MDFRGGSQGIPGNVSAFGAALLRVSRPISVSGFNLPLGVTDLYTVPAGRRAAVFQIALANPTALTIATQAEVKIAGSYFNVTAPLTTNTNTSITFPIGIILEAGQVLSASVATNPGISCWYQVFEFANTGNTRSVITTTPTLATGDNTLYTVPAGKSTLLLSENGNSMFYPIGGNVTAGLQAIGYYNDSGANRTVKINFVPFGGTPSSSNQVIFPPLGAPNANRTHFITTITMGSGDFINFNLDAGTATQIAWVNVAEF